MKRNKNLAEEKSASLDPESNQYSSAEAAEGDKSGFENNNEIVLGQLREFCRTNTEQFKDSIADLESFVSKIGEKFSEDDQKEIYDALMLMFTLHIYQEDRRDGALYASHPLSVSMKILDMSFPPDKDLVIAALLHDSVEDQSDKLSSLLEDKTEELTEGQRASLFIKKKYGQRVKDIVESLSNPDFDSMLAKQGITKSSPDYQDQKNKLYAEHVAAAIENPDVLRVKLADFADNALKLAALPTETAQQIAVRNKMKNKYLPVMEIFIKKLDQLDIYPEYKQKLEREMSLLLSE